MKVLKLLILSIIILSIGCYQKGDVNDDNGGYYNESRYKDGTYCADVEYYNPNTGTRNTYNLDVEVEDEYLTVIHWPNSGWLDNTHFHSEDISDGECSFSSDRGNRYTVTLNSYGSCGYTDEYKIRNDVNYDVETSTCSVCGNRKSQYDDYCEDCTQDTENSCQYCGELRTSTFDENCDYCGQPFEN